MDAAAHQSVASWLESIGRHKYTAAFAENFKTLADLRLATSEEGIPAVLEACGVKAMGDKAAIREALEALVNDQATATPPAHSQPAVGAPATSVPQAITSQVLAAPNNTQQERLRKAPAHPQSGLHLSAITEDEGWVGQVSQRLFGTYRTPEKNIEPALLPAPAVDAMTIPQSSLDA